MTKSGFDQQILRTVVAVERLLGDFGLCGNLVYANDVNAVAIEQIGGDGSDMLRSGETAFGGHTERR